MDAQTQLSKILLGLQEKSQASDEGTFAATGNDATCQSPQSDGSSDLACCLTASSNEGLPVACGLHTRRCIAAESLLNLSSGISNPFADDSSYVHFARHLPLASNSSPKSKR